MPWDLHPEYPPQGIPRSELLAKYGAAHVERVAQMFSDSGFAYAPHPDRVPNTQLALELGELARQVGLHATYHEAVMAAMWEQEQDVSDPIVLREIAVGVGLEAEAVDSALTSRSFRPDVEQSTREAHSAGINAVPAFVIGDRYLLMGAQPHEVFEQAIAQLQAEAEAN